MRAQTRKTIWQPIICFILLHLSSCASIHSKFKGFSIYQTLNLTKKDDGLDGELEVLIDNRVTPKDINRMKIHDPDIDIENSPRFKGDPLSPARLLLKSNNTQTITYLNLDKPYALLESANVTPHMRIILVTQDYSIGMGSYNGPITKLLVIKEGSITWAKAQQIKSGKSIIISLMRSLKSAWNFAPTLHGKDILAVNCHPNNNGGFTTVFARYHCDKHAWTVISRSEEFLWEAEDSNSQLGHILPSIDRFPSF